MIKVYQYSITNKSAYFFLGFSPFISLVRYFPISEHTWNTYGFVSFIVFSWIMSIIFIVFFTNRKKILFTEKGIQIRDFRRIIKDFSWNDRIIVDMDYKYLIKRIKITFGEDYVFLFEADRKTITKIIGICPVETVKQQFFKNKQ